MKKENVLILNGGGGNGYLLSKCISMSVLYHAVSASSYPEHSRFTFRDYKNDLPFVQDERFVDELNTYISEKEISFIIPTHDTIALVLMEKAEQINAVIVCSSLVTTRICRYKKETYKVLQGTTFLPKWFEKVEDVMDTDFPLFLKPNDGQGAKGVCLVNNRIESSNILDSNKDFVICENLPGEEFTVDCFTNSLGELLYVNPRKRAQISMGQSFLSVSVDDSKPFEEIASTINEKINFRGYWFVQLKRDKNGELKLLEICTRFAGGVAHALASGVNLPLLALADFSGKTISVYKNDYKIIVGKDLISRFELDLQYDCVYVDYDDTITSDNGKTVNCYMMAYLYQCRNFGKRIVMLTHHTATKSNSLYTDMKRLSIPVSLFDEIFDLPKSESKKDYIKIGIKSIFIDNSYIERLRVVEKCKIPVFDVCHIECLFDFRM